MNATIIIPEPTSIPSPVPSGGPVLMACDGSAGSCDALFNAARLASAALGGALEVIGVCEPMPGVSAGMDVLPVPADLDESRRATMLDDLRRAVQIAAAGDPSWPITVVLGSPPRTLAREAQRRQASLLVMGIGRHNPLDRLFGTETTLATLRESAHLALQLLGPGGRLTLVHVRPRFEHPSTDWQAWDADYSRTLPPLFEQLRADLQSDKGIIIETVTVRGDPAPTLLSYAQQANADLIAVGTQRHRFVERLVVGSVATRVLRTARVGVLAVPGEVGAS